MHRQRVGWKPGFLLLPTIVFALGGCAEDIEVVPNPTGQTTVVFDPSSTPPAIPTPTDLAVDRSTGLLNVPVADATLYPAQAYFDTFLNTLNGFPPTATAEVRFAGELDETTINAKTMPVFELDPANATSVTPVTGLTYEYKTVAETDGTTTSMVRVWNLAGWTRGMRYVFYVVGGANGVKNKNGNPVIRSALFELAAGANPLCAWDETRSWDSTTMSCTTPGVGGKATGCCTFNYSALIESTVKAQVRASAPETMTSDDVEKLIKATVLQKATDFEALRRGFEPLFALASGAKMSKDDVAVLWSFKVVDMNQAVFNPSAVPPQVPTPTDLIRNPKTGLLDVPDGPGVSAAEKEFNAYLRTLNGYPTGSTGSLAFTAALDSTTVDKGLLVYALDVTTTPPSLTQATDVSATFSETTNRVTISRTGGFARATTYVLAATGLKNKDTTLAATPRRTALMHLALSPHPLCENYDKATATCGGAALVTSFIDDPKSVTGGRTGKEKAALFETMRQGYDTLLTLISATDTTVNREDVVALWTFTVTSQSEVIFDPTTGVIPFPSDLLLDPTTGKVAIPATPGETPSQKALRDGLNTLDGFTTQGMYYAAYAGTVDAASATGAVLALETKAGLPVQMEYGVDATASAITATPITPLKEKTQYALVMISKSKAGDLTSQGGLKDDKGRYIVPASFMALLRNRNPVYDTTTKKSLLSTVDDATAAQIEPARLAFKALFDSLEAQNIAKREDIVCAWAFTTQSITKPLTQLRALPWKIFAAVDSNQPKFTGNYDPTFTGFPPTVPKDKLGAWVPNGVFKSWLALDQAGTQALLPDPTQGKAIDVPFMMSIPAGAMPTAGWPVVLFQHGITRAKTDFLAVANTLASVGVATIAFDIIYHGARTWCTKDDDCATSGTCDTATGVCSTSLVDANSDGIPDASGDAKFLNVDNPFAIRDNMRQHVVDASAMLRALALGATSGIAPADTVKIDPSKVYYVGQSLGSILGTLVLATDSLPSRAVLSVPGGPVTDIFLAQDGSPAFASVRTAVLQKMGITDGSIQYLQLMTTFNWIMDPADPGNFAQYVSTEQLPDLVKTTDPLNPVLVPKKSAIVQLTDNDQVIPVKFGKYLATVMGADITDTLYVGQEHGFLLSPSSTAPASPGATVAAQKQMATFLLAGTVCTPEVSSSVYTGNCN